MCFLFLLARPMSYPYEMVTTVTRNRYMHKQVETAILQTAKRGQKAGWFARPVQ